MSHVDAAACTGDALKAYTALYYHAKVSSGDTVLICDGTTVSYLYSIARGILHIAMLIIGIKAQEGTNGMYS